MPKVLTDKTLIETFLTRGVEQIYPNADFLRDRLQSGERLSMYLGIDPTGPTLHLGHAIALMKLGEFQKLGHRAVLLIGSFTGMIGDPTDKSATRKQLSREEVMANCKKYQEQAARFISFEGENSAEVVFNHEWLEKLSFKDIVELASHFTVQQMLERDMFERRLEEGKPIHLHEFLYPLMQGYDSVALDIDGEIGGNDQTFNMLAGRDLIKAMKGKEKFVLTMRLLTDPTGKKMGKSEGNMITMEDDAHNVYGKIMSWPDEVIISAFEICTRVADSDIEEMRQAMASGANPRNFKMRLGREVVALYHGDAAAQAAEDYFVKTIQKKEIPDTIEERVVASTTLVDVMVEAGMATSKSEARRLIEQGGIKVNNEVITDTNAEVSFSEDSVLVQRGKRQFVKVRKS